MWLADRDVKPPNILIDPSTGLLKIIDFGSAKQLVAGEPNVSYICSRYYRARECSGLSGMLTEPSHLASS